MNNNISQSMTGSSASSMPTSETVTDKLPRGSALDLQTIEMLGKRIVANPDGPDVKTYALEIVKMSSELLEKYMKQQGVAIAG